MRPGASPKFPSIAERMARFEDASASAKSETRPAPKPAVTSSIEPPKVRTAPGSGSDTVERGPTPGSSTPLAERRPVGSSSMAPGGHSALALQCREKAAKPEPKTATAPSPSPSPEADEGPTVAFSERDLLYGPDTGMQKPRVFLRKFVQSKTAEAGAPVWRDLVDSTLKVDCLTQGMGPNAPTPIKEKVGRGPVKARTDRPSTTGGLPEDWRSNTKIGARWAARAGDKAEFLEFVAAHPRFNPALSPEHTDWNKRFKRTSKAGLQFAIKEKGYNVHFVVPKDMDFHQVVREAGSHPQHATAKYEAYYQDGKGGETGPIEEKRITHAELRWLFRHKDDPDVAKNVQFWHFDSSKGSDGLEPVPAPWQSDPAPWDEYARARAAKSSRVGDSYSIGAPRTSEPEKTKFTFKDGAFTATRA